MLTRSLSRSGLDIEELQQLVREHEKTLIVLRGANILLTGATGWFGVWLLDALSTADDLLELKLAINAVSREPRRFLTRFPDFVGDPRIKWIKTDVRNLATHGQFSHVIHGATDTTVDYEPGSLRSVFDTTVDGTRKVLDATSAQSKGVLLLSSGAIYGPAQPDQVRFSESHAAGPDPSLAKNAYAEGKRAAEQLAAIAALQGVPVRIARCFAFVGPHMPFDRHFAIGNFIADAASSRPIRIRSDGRAIRSYLYMTDLIAALLTVLCHGAIGRTYNIGSDAGVSIEELAHLVNRAAGGCGVVVEGAPSDPADRYIPEVTRLKDELGFVPRVALEDAIVRTAAWYRSQKREAMPS